MGEMGQMGLERSTGGPDSFASLSTHVSSVKQSSFATVTPFCAMLSESETL